MIVPIFLLNLSTTDFVSNCPSKPKPSKYRHRSHQLRSRPKIDQLHHGKLLFAAKHERHQTARING